MGQRCKKLWFYLLQTDEGENELTMTSQWSFSGIGSFAHLDYVKCLTNPSQRFDIAVVGAPFDTAVTYRPGRH